jgi:hypothetical protein
MARCGVYHTFNFPKCRFCLCMTFDSGDPPIFALHLIFKAGCMTLSPYITQQPHSGFLKQKQLSDRAINNGLFISSQVKHPRAHHLSFIGIQFYPLQTKTNGWQCDLQTKVLGLAELLQIMSKFACITLQPHAQPPMHSAYAQKPYNGAKPARCELFPLNRNRQDFRP